MSQFLWPRRQCPPPVVVHRVICEHEIAIEVWPAEAEVHFLDDRYVDPVNTQVRFHAVVYNSPSGASTWEVTGPNGGAGQGTIDADGLYTAPSKGSLPHGTTDIVIATAVDDPLRRAFARVTLVGFGPEPALEAEVEVWPQQVSLYYREDGAGDVHNEFIDVSNKMQMFRAQVRNSPSAHVDWYVQVGGGPRTWQAGPDPWFLYEAPDNGADGTVVRITAQLQDDPTVIGEARAILINYRWPAIDVE